VKRGLRRIVRVRRRGRGEVRLFNGFLAERTGFGESAPSFGFPLRLPRFACRLFDARLHLGAAGFGGRDARTCTGKRS